MAANQVQFGITPPIAVNGPTDREVQVTSSLLQELKDRKMFETDQEAKVREVVLGRITAMMKEFVYRASLLHGYSEAQARTFGGKIYTFGSYRLGVHGPGSDIDTLCVVPKHVMREDFFAIFTEMLSNRDDVTEVAPVAEAYVPVIGAKFLGISIDFTFAKLALANVTDDLDLKDNNLLKNLDDRDVRSLGGSRVTDDILRLVPNVEVFRLALRCIKLWAQVRGIYSNVLGFFGGVAWAMLVARICQLYPNEVAGAIVSRFFIIYYQWKWPQPVLLRHIEEGPLPVRVWNPKLYPQDRSHRMPIITPAYPSMCATHNVSQSTQLVMTGEFKRAADVMDRIMTGRGQWSELFDKHDFFHRYKYYLQIIASSGSEQNQLKWKGTVEAKIRRYIMDLEKVPTILCAPPFVKGFDQLSHCANDEEVRLVATGTIPEAVAARTVMTDVEATAKEEATTGKGGGAEQKQEENGATGEWPKPIWSTTFYVGLVIEPKQPNEKARKLDISYPTATFVSTARQWDQYDHAKMGIVVKQIKCSQLPSYVFAGDERPPPKVKGKRAMKADDDGQDAPLKRHKTDPSTPLQPAPVTPGGNTLMADATATASSAENSASTIGVSVAEPTLPLQPGDAATEVENFRIATGTLPALVSSDPRDFQPDAPSSAITAPPVS